MTHPDGGPAFPHTYATGSPFERLFDGLSIRDYFAGQWLVGASQNWANSEPHTLAAEAYRMADAMIAERSKG